MIKNWFKKNSSYLVSEYTKDKLQIATCTDEKRLQYDQCARPFYSRYRMIPGQLLNEVNNMDQVRFWVAPYYAINKWITTLNRQWCTTLAYSSCHFLVQWNKISRDNFIRRAAESAKFILDRIFKPTQSIFFKARTAIKQKKCEMGKFIPLVRQW